jgi:hypothetical protein
MKAGRKALNNLFFFYSNRLRDGVNKLVCVPHPIQCSNRLIASSHLQRLLTDTLFPAAILRIQEDKISSLRPRGCHGKRFDTFVTPCLAGRVQYYFVLVRIIVVQYELALYLTASVRLKRYFVLESRFQAEFTTIFCTGLRAWIPDGIPQRYGILASW